MVGGMNAQGYKTCAKHFMIDRLITRYKFLGYHRLILGTGAEDDGLDSIFYFKQGFTKNRSSIGIYERFF
jgi:hypothetical protein